MIIYDLLISLQVISPFALTAAYFSIPEWHAIVHFQLSPKSFTITIVVITIMVRLLFAIFGAVLGWWKKLTPSLHTMPFNKVVPWLWTGAGLAMSPARRRRDLSDDPEAADSEV